MWGGLGGLVSRSHSGSDKHMRERYSSAEEPKLYNFLNMKLSLSRFVSPFELSPSEGSFSGFGSFCKALGRIWQANNAS